MKKITYIIPIHHFNISKFVFLKQLSHRERDRYYALLENMEGQQEYSVYIMLVIFSSKGSWGRDRDEYRCSYRKNLRAQV